jgi:preprotein translocase subunit SecY
MKKFGGFIPGIRPAARPPSTCSFVLSRITLPGSIYSGHHRRAAELLPELTGSGRTRTSRSAAPRADHGRRRLDTVKQIESQLMQRNYEGFLR